MLHVILYNSFQFFKKKHLPYFIYKTKIVTSKVKKKKGPIMNHGWWPQKG